MKTNKPIAYIFFLIGIILVLTILFDDIKKSKIMEKESRKNYSREISGIVSNVTQNRGTIKLRLKGSPSKIYYFGLTSNYKLEPCDLDDFLQGGDSIYKAPYSMEILVFRSNRKYRFVLEKSIKE